ncbi:hypothetical protein [Actinokineospora iranica]|uniref:DUF308 domain-containing protein n=1 Tax=Actinokineospora iranica TaxID=1271860 RepID=A0A1G6M107_9PSEU|nr:hypothetical protein [Actinokineospora iranica]SDC48675.1 hypothetical protein SAMN05216174_102310 [Actinokineospora iranica]
MKGRPGDGPEDVDAAFAQIVAGLERDGVGRNLPSEAEVKRDHAESPRPGDADQPAEPPGPPPPTAWRGHDTEIDWSDDNADEHYEPPEPPPLPRLRPATIVAIALLVAGVVLLILPSVIGLGARIATPIALLSLASGIGLLLLRARRHPHEYPDGDDGAQV